MPPADREKRVDDLRAGQQRLGYGLTVGNSGGFAFDRPDRLRTKRTAAIEWRTERIDHATEQPVTDGHTRDAAREPHFIARRHLIRRPQKESTDFLRAKVKCQRGKPVATFQQLAVPYRWHPAEIRHPIADTDDVPDLAAADFPPDLLQSTAKLLSE